MCECGHGLDAFGTHLTCCLFRGQWIVTHNVIKNIMYAFAQKNEHVVWKERRYAFMSKVSLQANLYMICEDQVFVVDVVVIDLTQKKVATNVISWPICIVVELNTIIKICKYGRLHERHHFIPMVMEVHDVVRHDMNRFFKKCAHFFP